MAKIMTANIVTAKILMAMFLKNEQQQYSGLFNHFIQVKYKAPPPKWANIGGEVQITRATKLDRL